MPSATSLVGRDEEWSLLLAAMHDAARGEPSAVLVHGEPGIGKTSLVRALATQAGRDGFHVLLGTALRFGADVSSYLPFNQAMSGWVHSTPDEDRIRVYGRPVTLRDLAPALGDVGSTRIDSGRALLQVTAAIDRLVDDAPTLLLMDDLHWADPSSLDLIAYLVAGFAAGRRLQLVGTYRDTGLVDGHRLHGWLADIRRMPRVTTVDLARLDSWGTELLVAQLVGDGFSGALAEQVYRRSDGNPYLAELLAASVTAEGSETPAGDNLRDALLGAWHRLTPSARQVTQLLAVGGLPVPFTLLRDLGGSRGLRATDVARAVVEAVSQSIAVSSDGLVWFRHPLLAEVIGQTLAPADMAQLHQACAQVWMTAHDVSERDRANRLALHLTGALRADEGFRWSLRAAQGAADVQARREQASHLANAVALVQSLSHDVRATVDEVGLLAQVGRAAEAAGELSMAVDHYERALALIDETERPQEACRMMLDVSMLRALVGRDDGMMDPAYLRLAVALTDGLPVSEERSLALAHLAFAEVWKGMPEATAHAQEALAIAREMDSQAALVWALAVRSQTKWGSEEGVRDAQQAVELARGQADGGLLLRAAISLNNCYQENGQLAASAAMTGQVYQELVAREAYREAAVMGGIAAELNLTLGRFASAREHLREVLSLRHGRSGGGSARCVAAVLAGLEGDPVGAAQHLRRAHELEPNPQPVGDHMFWADMHVAIALGDPRRALELAESVVPAASGVNNLAADEYLGLAGQAAADLAESDLGPGEVRAEATARLATLERVRSAASPPFRPTGALDHMYPALGALYAADRARCEGDRSAVAELWRAAVEATELADLRHETARSLFHLGSALLRQSSGRREATAALEEARHIADDLMARPLVARIDELAAQAHVVLGPWEDADPLPGPLSEGLADVRLTGREREVLSHLVSGETYAQMARALFISEKTVSVHVSNLLHKTGTANRIELAALALRSRGKAEESGDAEAAGTR